MMRWTAAVAVSGASLLSATAAPAGTYDLVSCGAPGAGGVNRAWGAKVDVPGIYEVADCGSALFAAGSAAPNQTAPYFTSANWSSSRRPARWGDPGARHLARAVPVAADDARERQAARRGQ